MRWPLSERSGSQAQERHALLESLAQRTGHAVAQVEGGLRVVLQQAESTSIRIFLTFITGIRTQAPPSTSDRSILVSRQACA
ncbi:MAG: hypothetical protein B7X93_08955 [Hydrogenophilales bacterium 17-61-9]|nr:MAG: hypothetical protein B7X93_08955 [Hydrogenophilales bacterium 17-61-9]